MVQEKNNYCCRKQQKFRFYIPCKLELIEERTGTRQQDVSFLLPVPVFVRELCC